MLIRGETMSSASEQTHVSIALFIRDTDKLLIPPLEYDQARDRIVNLRVAGVEKLDKNERINRTSPSFSTVHSCYVLVLGAFA